MIHQSYRPRFLQLLGSGAVVLLLGCTDSSSDFWTSSASYTLHLQVRERGPHLPELPLPPTDSLEIRLTIDSIVRDSLFGRYEGRLDSLGIDPGGVDRPLVAGIIRGKAFELVITPHHIDAETFLRGTTTRVEGSGTWYQPSAPSSRGDFLVRRMP